jgi:methylated-DNA-[protein]-cysteine S-methyltransferase
LRPQAVPIFIPCHRVLAAHGIGGYSGGQGLPTKRALLTLEGNLLI